uniref:Resistance protein candidate n=1 Tax=Lactuca sativa TaxID=4236 RepID=O48894_LACSA|nr:resistance protein candidate [Lactuca sativa]
MDVVNAILKPVVETLMVPVKKHIGYLISCRQYMREMGIKMRGLNATRLGVEEHVNRNISNQLEVPAQVRGWFEEVGKINAKVENFPSDVGSCFNLKVRHGVGKRASKIIEDIDSVMREHSIIIWNDHSIPLGRIDSTKASTSIPSTDHHDEFQSREQTFTEALNALDPNHKSHMIALWGMGGVGKTTMMHRLKKVVKEKKMFNFIIEAVVGEKTDPIAIQSAVADYLGIELNEKTKPARTEKLRKWFVDNSGGKKILVILDDVWQFVDLNDIGLSPLPNQGVDFKVLLTSRDKDVCTEMGAEVNSTFNVKMLIETEAQSLFHQFIEISDDVDPELHNIGVNIVRKCGGLPIAIKTMACTLRGKSKDAWKNALLRLEHYDIENIVNGVFKMSYDNLQDEETKSTFLLCGMYPEDFDILTEELVRYGWGLKLFKKVYTIGEARTRLNTCIERLIHTNLLMEVDDVRCIKMHDLVRAFVLDMYSKVEHASIVNHSNTLEWHADNMHDSCKRLSLTCKGMSKFPTDLKFPNLSILKLMHEDISLRFPKNFYEEMEKLEVISYDKMKYPLLPSSPQCSVNLRVFHLHKCSLVMFDCSCIGNLSNLEVLSFADSAIDRLPSTIGKLKKLRLLDLTNCYGVRIDNGVLKKLVKLEELYMTVVDRGRKAISLTDDNCKEMAERSKDIYALELEFFENDAQPKNMSFEKLQRFQISVGRYLYGDSIKSRHSYENTLKLVLEKGELLEARMNELFKKTEVLCLSVGDMNDLEDIEVKSSSQLLQSSSFNNLRVLVVSKCAELKHFFTPGVANTLKKLEHLEVYKCDNMEELIRSRGSEEETITFPKLKFLSLCGLPKLSGLCDNVKIIELPQLMELELDDIPGFTSIYPMKKFETFSLLKEEVLIPKLEKLHVSSMWNLKEIWPCEFNMSEEVKFREIKVSNCDKLVNLFPHKPISLLHHLEELKVKNCGSIESLFNIHLDCVGATGDEYNNSGVRIIKVISCDKLVNLFPHNPMSILHHLEELEVENCGSIESLFNIDLDCAGAIGQEDNSISLRNIKVENLGKLREVWRIKGGDNSRPLVHGFQSVESIRVTKCKKFRNVFTPTTTNFNLGALLEISIDDCGENRGNDESEESSHEQEQVRISISLS